MIAWVLALLFDRSPEAFFPCEPGLTVTYSTGSSTLTDRVVGFVHPVEPKLCVLDRNGGRWAREHIPDRVAYAGELDQLLAFRPILLKRPVFTGARWHYNRTDYVISAVGAPVTVPAGTFTDTVWIEESSADGAHRALSVYVAGVGLVRHARPGFDSVAVSVVRAGAL